MFQPYRWVKLVSSISLSFSLFLVFSGFALAQSATVTATDPVTNAVGVALTQTLAITFDQTISATTVNSGTVVMQGMMGGVVTGTYAVSGAQVTITPTRSFFPNELVRTTVTSNTQNLNGDDSVPYQWQFSAGEVRQRCVAGFSDSNAGLTGASSGNAVWGDYDNDGDLDFLMTGDTGSTKIAQIYRNDNGAFTDINAGLTGLSSSSAAWGDYDNDGDLDILLSGEDSNAVRYADVYRNDNGSFSNSNAGLTGASSGNAVWGDYDNDGDLDILLTGSTSSVVIAQIYRNDNGAFTNINAGLTGVSYGSGAGGDYDNDGDLDILITGDSSTNVKLATLYRNDNGSFSNSNAGLTGVVIGSVAWGDYDNDGDLDILLSGYSSSGRVAQVYRNEGGSFTNINAGLTGVYYSSVAWGDVDNDGDLDILLAGDSASGRVAQVYRNDGGSFSNSNAGLTEVSYSSVAWGDVDNDGDLDILLAGDSASGRVAQVYRNGDCPAVTATDPMADQVGIALTSTISITYNQPISAATVNSGTVVMQGMMGGVVTGTYAVSGAQVTITPTRSFFANELVRTTVTSSTQNLNGDDSIPYQWQFSAGEVRTRCLAGFSDIHAGLTTVDFGNGTWGDYDNDGDLDVLLTGYPGIAVIANIYRNDHGVFSDINAGLTGVANSSVAWGDYDNDGDLDILLSGMDNNSARIAKIYRNDNGSFTDINAGLTGVWVSSVAWGDYDNDGDLDILLAGWSEAGYVSQIYRNDEGSFSDINAGLVGVNYGDVAWGDYDNDGDLDILLTGLEQSSFIARIYQNDNGSFSDINAGLTSVKNGSVDWGDYDNDGDLDILLSGNSNPSGITLITQIYRNDGGSFTDINAGLPGVQDSSADWGDYDNDGDLDILLVGEMSDSSRVSRIYRNLNGSFSDIAVGLIGVATGNAEWGDYNNDGDLDILLTGQSSSDRVAAIYRNGDCPVADAGADQTVFVDTPLTLDGSASLELDDSELNYSWHTSNGSSLSFSPNLSVTTFSAPATPTVLTFTLTITSSDGFTDTDSTVITVSEIAISGLQATNDSPTQLGNQTILNAMSSEGSNIDYSWDFGDGNSGSGAQVNHIYADVGTYTATVTASNSVSTFSTTTLVTIIDVPLADDQSIMTDEDMPLAITLTASDVDGSLLSFQAVDMPQNGSLTGTAPNLVYTPTANFHGSDSFTFRASDGEFDSDLATVEITVDAVNDAPLANAQALTVAEDSSISLTLTGSDLDLDVLDFSVVEMPLHGTLTGIASTLRYTPTANFHGVDQFTFDANDGDADSDLATVTITVTALNDTPLANAQALTVTEDSSISIKLTGSDLDSDVLAFSIVNAPAHGKLTGIAPNLRYTPTANFHGSDSFTFRANDGKVDSALATVMITVTAVDDTPIVVVPLINTSEDAEIAVTLPISDADGDSLTYVVTTPPLHGTMSGVSPNFIYTPDANFHGEDSVTFSASDGKSGVNASSVNTTTSFTVILQVTDVNDAPLANNRTITTTGQTPINLALFASDADSDVLSYQITAQPAHGQLSGSAADRIYTAAANFSGSDTVTFVANDGQVNSAPATITIVVLAPSAPSSLLFLPVVPR